MRKGYRFYLFSIIAIIAATSQHASAQSFSGGATQTISVCENSTNSVDTLLSIIDTVSGQTDTWSTFADPANGTLVASYTTTSDSGVNVPSGLSYVPNTGYSGMDSFKVQVTNGTVIDYTTVYVTVNPLPVAGAISGASNVCVGSTITFTADSTGGVWSATNGNATVAAGVVTGVTGGLDTIQYTITNGCGVSTTTQAITVDTTLVAGVLSGASGVCIGSTATLTADADGGVWSATNGNATVAAGVVTGVIAGADTIIYTLTNSCNSVSDSASILIDIPAVSGAISGPSNVCIGSTITFTADSTGGVWSATNGNATIAAGVVTGVTGGIDTIQYTVTTGCGVSVTTQAITVDTALVGAALSSAGSVCVGSTVTISTGTTGVVWSATNGNATVAAGVVTGVTPGMDTIVYTITNSCNSVTDSASILIDIPAVSGAISGASNVCAGSTTTFTADSTGGVWSTTNGNATIAAGVVTGVTGGIDTIQYTVTTGCGVSVTTQAITVDTTLVAGTISGAATLCVGSTVTFTADAVGGVWSATNGSATVVAGDVTGVTPGTDTVVYTITNTCNSVADSASILIDIPAVSGAISGATNVCVGSTTTFTADSTGGVWSATNGNATIAAGVVTGVTGGIDTIQYTVTTGCGASVTTQAITVDTTLVAGAISGAATLCVGSTVTFTADAVGGVWSATNGSATVAAGDVTGVTPGTDTIVYTITNTCNSVADSASILIDIPAVSGAISGASNVCVGSTTTFTADSTGGVWSATNGNATIAAGVVTGVTGGADTIQYTVTTGCGVSVTTQAITVDTTLVAGAISGAATLCVGSTVTFTADAVGGVWSATNGSATVATGDVTGVTPGTDTIVYTITNSCNSIADSASILIDIPAVSGAISGASNVCLGSTITFTADSTGGVWSATNGNATIAAGVVTGVTGGADTIQYTVTTGCGVSVASQAITVDTTLVAGAISGSSSVCTGSTVTLTESATGGVWSATNGNATVAAGVVTGVTTGTDTIIYTRTNSCGSVADSQSIIIDIPAVSGTITGVSSVCHGSAVTLTASVTGGVWSATNGNATVAAGVVTGVTGGADTIEYTVTTGCGVSVTTQPITVDTTLVAGTLSGAANVCAGATVTFTASAAGGVWSATNGKATVAAGVVTGVATGTDTIVYTVSNSCGSVADSQSIIVDAPAVAGTISGAANVCLGSTATFTATVTGGVWSAINGHATVAAGVVTGVTAGTDTIIYTVSNSCGSVADSQSITVDAPVVAGTISGASNVCIGSTATLTASVTGGVWSAINSHATVVAGVVTGVTAGTDTILYTRTNSCGSVTDSLSIIIDAPAVAGTISGGASNVCIGSTTTFTASVTGGVWSATNGSATVASGVATGVTAGTDTIVYTVSNSCGSVADSQSLIVNAPAVAGTISGATYVCMASTITLTDAATGGVWSATNGNATVAASIVTGVTPGYDTINYSVTNVCGSDTATYVVKVLTVEECDSVSAVNTVVATISELKMYPNPSTGVFNIELPETGNVAISIMDFTGKVVMTKNVVNNQPAQTTIDISSLPSGNYIIKADAGDKIFRGKMTLVK